MSSDRKPKKVSTKSFWRATKFLGPYRAKVVASIICAFIAGTIMTSGIATMMPILHVLVDGQTVKGWVSDSIQKLHDRSDFGAWAANHLQWATKLAGRLPTDPVKTVAVLFSLIAIIAIVGNVFRYFYEYTSDQCAIDAINDIRRKLYNHAMHVPLSFFGMKGTSDITSRLLQDCQGLQEGFTILMGQTTLEIFRAALAFALAMAIDWRLTMFIVAFAPIAMAVIRKFGKRMRRASRAALQNSAMMLGQIESTLGGIRVVKASTAERFERRRYNIIASNLRNEQLKLAHYDALSTPTLETMGLLVIGSVLIFATYLMFSKSVSHPLSTIQFFAIMVSLVQIGEALRRVSKVNVVVQKCSAAAARIFEALDEPIERPRLAANTRDGQLINLPPIAREVKFNAISFTYPGTNSPAIVDVDLTVKKGTRVAIVGRNGSGKTTLMALLPRFYDPESGSVSIDGIDLRNVTLRSLRKQISVVTQDSVIFPGTIAENIAYGLPLSSREQIEIAAKRAFAHEFILEKPLGYDTPLDGLGGQLSGGQKQRLSIARAILRNAPILILDEATSQVDAESEHLIQQAIDSLMHDENTPTIFVIAHRFSTILGADWVVVMDRGKVVGQGTHEELLRTCETYQQLYERQLIAAK